MYANFALAIFSEAEEQLTGEDQDACCAALQLLRSIAWTQFCGRQLRTDSPIEILLWNTKPQCENKMHLPRLLYQIADTVQTMHESPNGQPSAAALHSLQLTCDVACRYIPVSGYTPNLLFAACQLFVNIYTERLDEAAETAKAFVQFLYNDPTLVNWSPPAVIHAVLECAQQLLDGDHVPWLARIAQLRKLVPDPVDDAGTFHSTFIFCCRDKLLGRTPLLLQTADPAEAEAFADEVLEDQAQKRLHAASALLALLRGV
jgi:hypothetical protein